MRSLDALAPRWPQINALLDEALDLPASRRLSWLEQLGGAHAECKDTLRRLLSARAPVQTDDFLADLPRLDSAGELVAGGVVGPYRLIRELGEGGMGVVWLAERCDGAIARQIALKVPFASRLERHLSLRFDRERDILARLEHAHIARLYDAGVDRQGLPYLAMEYVEGKPIDAFCDDAQLGIAARIGLFVQVLDAVQFAHANLVIHRDLKPSNILVTPAGQVRLLDFGIAKLLGDETRVSETALTQMWGRALTLEYASPEQTKGEPLGTATDVYSLGVVLYRLLTGQRPYRLALDSPAQLEQAIVADEPQRPSNVVDANAARARGTTAQRLKRELAGDLDTIVQKALAKKPSDRYATVAALAQDLDDHLKRKPIAARPARIGLRLVKLVQRNRLAAAALAGVAVSLVAGLAIALWQADAARAQARVATAAVARYDSASQLYVELLTTVAAWDGNTFAQPNAIPELLTRKLDELQPQYEQKTAEWAGILNAAQLLYSFLDQHESALATSMRHLEALERSGADLQTIVAADVSVARNASQLGRLDLSEDMLRRAISRVKNPTSAQSATLHVGAASDLAVILLLQDRRAEARALLREARLLGGRHIPAEGQFAVLLRTIGRIELSLDSVAALAALQQAHAILVARNDTPGFELSETRMYLGQAYLQLGRLDEALGHLRDAHASNLQLYGATNAQTLVVQTALALASARAGDDGSATEMLRASRRELQGKTELQHVAMAAVIAGRQIEVALAAGDVGAANDILRSLPRHDTFSPMIPNRQVLPLARFETLMQQNAVDEAGAALERFRGAIAVKLLPNEDFLVRIAQTRLLLARGDAGAATRMASDTVRAMRAAGIDSHWILVVAQEWAALAAAESGDHDAAAAHHAAAASRRDTLTAPSRVDEADSNLRQARVVHALGDPDRSRALARNALELMGKQHAESPRRLLARQLAGLAS